MIMILFYTNTASWSQSLIKQPKTIQIPLLLPGVRPVSNLFKFKKKWLMGKATLFNSLLIVVQMSANSNLSLDWHLFDSPSILGQMSTNSYTCMHQLQICWLLTEMSTEVLMECCLDQEYWLRVSIDS